MSFATEREALSAVIADAPGLSSRYGDVLVHRRFMADPEAMRAMAGRFDAHAQTVGDEARRIWSLSGNGSGADWDAFTERPPEDAMGQIQTAIRNIVTMLHWVRDGMTRDAIKYEYQEAVSQQILSRRENHDVDRLPVR